MRRSRSIYLVARREIRERLRTRAFQVSTALLVAGVVAVVAIVSATTGDDVEEVSVAAVGEEGVAILEATSRAAGEADLEVQVTREASVGDAEEAIAREDLDAAIGPREQAEGVRLLVAEGAPSRLGAFLEQMASSITLREELTAAGLSSDELEELMRSASVESAEVAPEGPDDGGMAIALIISIVLYVAIFSSGYTVTSGVVEEKGSRVVEILLGTLEPRELLAGKVAGIGLVSLAQLAAVLAAGLTATLTFGTFELPDAAAPTAILALVFFVLGYIFYGCAFAAAGAIVSRQEDSQSTTAPLMVALIGSYIFSFNVLENPDTMAAQVLSYIPVSAPLVVPAREAAGSLPVEQLLGALAAMAVGCTALIWAAGKIYERAVLRTGAPLKPAEAVRLLRG